MQIESCMDTPPRKSRLFHSEVETAFSFHPLFVTTDGRATVTGVCGSLYCAVVPTFDSKRRSMNLYNTRSTMRWW